jgi:transcriptional regulator with GAF, ATPase, and Fis domain
MRLCQKVVLGVTGVQMFRALGHAKIKRFHMNEGHASFLKPSALHFLNVRTGGTICVPMMGQGQPLGLLHLAWTESNTAQDMSDVESRNIGLSEIFALTLANVRLHEELKDRLFMIR